MKIKDFISAEGDSICPSDSMEYLDGFKYQLKEDLIVKTDLNPAQDIVAEFVVLRSDGWLFIKSGFSWDGCSGPTIDTKTNMRAGLCHDALYYLHRRGLLPLTDRKKSDIELYKIMLRDGSCKPRAKYYLWAVRKFAFNAAAIRRKVKRIFFKKP